MHTLLATLALAAGVHGANATSYCLHGTMSDGTYTRSRSAANNSLPLGTKITLVGRQTGPGGMRRYVVRDHIGWGTELDLWTPTCGVALAWGRRYVRFRIGRPHGRATWRASRPRKAIEPRLTQKPPY